MAVLQDSTLAGATPRERIEALLRDTTPSVDAGIPYAHGLSSEQFEVLRRLIPEPLTRAAVLVPLVERGSGLQVLFTQRASHLKNHPGQVSFPGGRMEPADVGPWEAALRETHEEIGLDPRFVSKAGYLPDQVVITGFRVTPVVGFVQPGFTLQLDATEVDSVFEVPLEFVLDPANHVPRSRELPGLTLTTYDIPFEDRHIWGATANMLVAFSRLLRGGSA